MKLSVIFLFVALVVAFYAVVEKVKCFLNSKEFEEAMNHHYMNYVWSDLSYGALR